jgi:hypothetical protein
MWRKIWYKKKNFFLLLSNLHKTKAKWEKIIDFFMLSFSSLFRIIILQGWIFFPHLLMTHFSFPDKLFSVPLSLFHFYMKKISFLLKQSSRACSSRERERARGLMMIKIERKAPYYQMPLPTHKWHVRGSSEKWKLLSFITSLHFKTILTCAEWILILLGVIYKHMEFPSLSLIYVSLPNEFIFSPDSHMACVFFQ